MHVTVPLRVSRSWPLLMICCHCKYAFNQASVASKLDTHGESCVCFTPALKELFMKRSTLRVLLPTVLCLVLIDLFKAGVLRVEYNYMYISV